VGFYYHRLPVDQKQTRNVWQSLACSLLSIAGSPVANSTETKLSTHRHSAQQWRRQAKVAKLTPLLIYEGMHANNPLTPGYWTESHQIYKHVDTSLPFNTLKSELGSSKPFQNAGVINKGE